MRGLRRSNIRVGNVVTFFAVAALIVTPTLSEHGREPSPLRLGNGDSFLELETSVGKYDSGFDTNRKLDSLCDNRNSELYHFLSELPAFQKPDCRDIFESNKLYDKLFNIATWFVENREPKDGLWNTSTCSQMKSFKMINNMSDDKRTCICWTTKSLVFASGVHLKIAARSASNYSMGLFSPHMTAGSLTSRGVLVMKSFVRWGISVPLIIAMVLMLNTSWIDKSSSDVVRRFGDPEAQGGNGNELSIYRDKYYPAIVLSACGALFLVLGTMARYYAKIFDSRSAFQMHTADIKFTLGGLAWRTDIFGYGFLLATAIYVCYYSYSMVYYGRRGYISSMQALSQGMLSVTIVMSLMRSVLNALYFAFFKSNEAWSDRLNFYLFRSIRDEQRRLKRDTLGGFRSKAGDASNTEITYKENTVEGSGGSVDGEGMGTNNGSVDNSNAETKGENGNGEGDEDSVGLEDPDSDENSETEEDDEDGKTGFQKVGSDAASFLAVDVVRAKGKGADEILTYEPDTRSHGNILASSELTEESVSDSRYNALKTAIDSTPLGEKEEELSEVLGTSDNALFAQEVEGSAWYREGMTSSFFAEIVAKQQNLGMRRGDMHLLTPLIDLGVLSYYCKGLFESDMLHEVVSIIDQAIVLMTSLQVSTLAFLATYTAKDTDVCETPVVEPIYNFSGCGSIAFGDSCFVTCAKRSTANNTLEDTHSNNSSGSVFSCNGTHKVLSGTLPSCRCYEPPAVDSEKHILMDFYAGILAGSYITVSCKSSGNGSTAVQANFRCEEGGFFNGVLPDCTI